jgi:hypothetical protein
MQHPIQSCGTYVENHRYPAEAHPINLQMSGSSDGKSTLYDSRPPRAMHIHPCQVNMSYNTEPLTAGFLPVLPDARGAKVAAMSFTFLSATLSV